MQLAVAQTLRQDCALTFANSNKEAREQLEKNNFDLVLLDLTLPDGDGFKICNFIRKSATLHALPVIFITGRAEIEDKEMAFSIGADDYIVKPINNRELRARVLARLERTRASAEHFATGNLKFDLATQRVSTLNHDEEYTIETTFLEFRLLLYFAKHPDQVFSREQLLNAVWGESLHLFERTIDTHISHLRKKLAAAYAEFTIRSVRGSGYKLTLGKVSKRAA